MKTIHKLSLVLLIALLGSCATTVQFPVSQIVPAADGEVKLKQDRNGNYLIDLSVKHLASPERLNPPRSQYIVWVQDETGKHHNIGRLAINNSRAGSLKATTPHKPSQIFITAQDAGNITWPGRHELFRTDRLNLD